MVNVFLSSCRAIGGKEVDQTGGAATEMPVVPEMVLSLVTCPEEAADGVITDLSLPWAALVLLPHLR